LAEIRRRRFWHATLRLRSAIGQHRPPQRAVLSQICCFGERKVVAFQILWKVLSHVMRGRPGCLLRSAGWRTNRILLVSALSSMHIMCPNRVSQCDWIIAVSLGCFVSLRTSLFQTNWYHTICDWLQSISGWPISTCRCLAGQTTTTTPMSS